MKIGFVSLPLSGHLLPMTALARVLQARGHEVIFFGVPDAAPIVGAAGIGFVPCGEAEYPSGAVAKVWAPIAHLQGLEVMRYAVAEISTGMLSAMLRHLPRVLKKAGVEALVIDTAQLFTELVPMSMNIPFVQVWNVLHSDPSGATPPSTRSWPHEATPEARARNVEGLKQTGALFAPLIPIARAFAEEVGLAIDWRQPGATASRLAVITQTPEIFDFPGVQWPPQFHYAGPLSDASARAPVPFAWDRLDGRPLIYASMGTLVNGLATVQRAILDAAGRLADHQIVFSFGGNVDANGLGAIPPNVIAVPAAPQLELLRRAVLCFTHAGLNTVLEALGAGVPMVAIPIGYDQPGVAARIAHHGVGEFVDVQELTADALSTRIRTVLGHDRYRAAASRFRDAIARIDGPARAADIVEQAFAGARSPAR